MFVFLFRDGPLMRGGGGGGLAERFISPEMKQKIADVRKKVDDLVRLEREEKALLERLDQFLRGGK